MARRARAESKSEPILPAREALAIMASSEADLAEMPKGKKVDANDIAIQGKEAFDKWLQESPTVQTHLAVPNIYTLGRLRQEYPVMHEPVIDGLLREGEVMNIVAAPKMGKSMLGGNIAMCVISGKKLFDQFPCKKGRVLIIDNELHPPTIAHRLETIANAHGIPENLYSRMIDVLPLRGRLQDVKSLGDYISKIACKRYAIIILDAWYKLLPEGTNENSNADIAGLYSVLDSYSEELKSALIVVHHFAKGLHGDKNATDLGAGAGAQSRAADTHLGILEHKEQGVAVIKAAVRSFKPFEPFCARFKYPKWEAAPGYSATDAKTTSEGGGPAGASKQEKNAAEEAAWAATLQELTTPMEIRDIIARAQIKGALRTGRDKALVRAKGWVLQGLAKEIAPDGPRGPTKYVLANASAPQSAEPVGIEDIADAYVEAADEARD